MRLQELGVRWLAALAATAFAACGGQSASQSGPVYPAGVDTATAAKDLKGISPANSTATCCWMSKRNRLMLAIPDSANSMTLTIEVPVNIYKSGQQGVSVELPGQPAQHRSLDGGRQDVTVTVPAADRGHKIPVGVVLDASFVPAKIGMNNDTTEYTVFLRSVAFS